MSNDLINYDDLTPEQLQVLSDKVFSARLKNLESNFVEVKDQLLKQGRTIEKIKNEMTIDYAQQEELRTIANKKVVETLGYGSPAYKELSKKAFSTIWNDYKKALNVNSYRNTAIEKFEDGKCFLNIWKPNRELELMILGANSQTEIRLVKEAI